MNAWPSKSEWRSFDMHRSASSSSSESCRFPSLDHRPSSILSSSTTTRRWSPVSFPTSSRSPTGSSHAATPTPWFSYQETLGMEREDWDADGGWAGLSSKIGGSISKPMLNSGLLTWRLFLSATQCPRNRSGNHSERKCSSVCWRSVVFRQKDWHAGSVRHRQDRAAGAGRWTSALVPKRWTRKQEPVLTGTASSRDGSRRSWTAQRLGRTSSSRCGFIAQREPTCTTTIFLGY